MFQDVPECSGMFQDVPECSGMFHVPGFIDAQVHIILKTWRLDCDVLRAFVGTIFFLKIGLSPSVLL